MLAREIHSPVKDDFSPDFTEDAGIAGVVLGGSPSTLPLRQAAAAAAEARKADQHAAAATARAAETVVSLTRA